MTRREVIEAFFGAAPDEVLSEEVIEAIRTTDWSQPE